MNRGIDGSEQAAAKGGKANFHHRNSNVLRYYDTNSGAIDRKPPRSLLERVLMPMLVAAAAFIGVLMCVATYEFGTNTDQVPLAIGNWVTVLAACILIILGVLAIFSDSNAP